MKTRHVGRVARMLLVTLVSILAAATARADLSDTIEKSFPVAPGGWLKLDAEKGSIEVRTSPEPRVDVRVDLHVDAGSERKARRILDDFSVDMARTENGIRIDAGYGSGDPSFWNRDRKRLKVRFVISVPEQFNLHLNTSGGGIEVADVNGQVSSRTSGGSLRFGSITGTLEASTSGGSIRLRGCSGPVDVRTSGGSIRIAKAAGPVSAETSGGSIRVDEVTGRINARTSGGSIEVYISRQPDGACSLKTSGGSINVYLAQGIGLDIDAETSGGGVRSDLPVTVTGELKRSALKGKINAGGPQMVLRTSGGDIGLLKH